MYDFHKDKFSNLGLYEWMSSQLQNLYRSAFELAHDMAMKSQKAYQNLTGDLHEYIKSGGNYWDSQKFGFFAGDKLIQDVQRLERAYVEAGTKELEVSQSFSLAQIAPVELLRLQETGGCTMEIPEFMFDLTYPGQYRRKIKAVSLTIPAVTGPYTNVGCRLSLIAGAIRLNPDSELSQDLGTPVGGHTVATSNANNDHGKFELNFRGERFMPFEGAGAISNWSIQLPETLRQFDYSTISDVIITINYTAQEDMTLRTTVEQSLRGQLTTFSEEMPLTRIVDMKKEMSTEFYRLMNPEGEQNNTLLNISSQLFPYYVAREGLLAENIIVMVESVDADLTGKFEIKMRKAGTSQGSELLNAANSNKQFAWAQFSFNNVDLIDQWELSMSKNSALSANDMGSLLTSEGMINSGSIKNIYLMLQYKIT